MKRCIVRVGDKYVAKKGFTSSIDRAYVFPSLKAGRKAKGDEVIPVNLVVESQTATVWMHRVEKHCPATGSSIELLPTAAARERLESLLRAGKGSFEFHRIQPYGVTHVYKNKMHETLKLIPIKINVPIDSIEFRG